MKKKGLLIAMALLVLVSGVAAVSAFEAHAINVKAKVENALSVSDLEVDYGTVFPEEFIIEKRTVGLSDSFLSVKHGSGRVNAVDIEFWAECKLMDDNGTPDPADDTYYPWLGEAIWLATGAEDISGPWNCTTQQFDPPDGIVNLADDTFPDREVWENVGQAPCVCPGAIPVLVGRTLGLQPFDGQVQPQIDSFELDIAIDVPVFEGYYNPYTDVCPKPNGLDTPTWVIEMEDPRWIPTGSVMGLDIKVQVVDIRQEPVID
jgi:hypothetical protein